VDLSKKERLFLYNQLEILKCLKAEDEIEVRDIEKSQKILTNGYKEEYDSFITWFSDDIPYAISKFVVDVLNLHRTLYFSYEKLNDEDKAKLEFSKIKYRGFDGNEESEYMSYASYILEDLKSYKEIYEDGKCELNSHMPVAEYRYAGMLERFSELGVSPYTTDLTLDQILRVVES